MDLQQQGDGRQHFTLGRVEKWIVGAIATAFVAGGLWLVSSVQTLVTQMAVANAQLSSLNNQLSDVPGLSKQVVELKVRVDNHDDEIDELRSVRNLK
jgi:hypothetical protein